MSDEFEKPPDDETVPPVGASDRGAPEAPEPPDDGTVYVDPMEAK